MLFQIKSYLRFLLASTNEHGVHSPFVYNLVTRCFYDRRQYPKYRVLKQYRSALLNNKANIRVTDFGSGSKVFKSNTRSVAKIASTAGISKKRAELLLRVANYFEPTTILEIGTSVGLATAALSVARSEPKIITLEGCKATSAVAKQQFKMSGLRVPTFEITEFTEYLTSKTANQTFDLVYIDGNHTREATLQYFELLLPTITNDTVWIFDDIHWSAAMERAWELIKVNPRVTVTIDTFQWGFVFFRREQEKEHFTIRV